ncbi:hypothetical protein R6Q57_014598 [Mikania cordata]
MNFIIVDKYGKMAKAKGERPVAFPAIVAKSLACYPVLQQCTCYFKDTVVFYSSEPNPKDVVASLQQIDDFSVVTIAGDFFSSSSFFFSVNHIVTFLATFSHTEKTSQNSHKFGFTLSPANYSYLKAIVQSFLVTNSLFGYVDGTIPRPSTTVLSTTLYGKDKEDAIVSSSQHNPLHAIWVANDAHVWMLIFNMFKALHLMIFGYLLSVRMLLIHRQENIL